MNKTELIDHLAQNAGVTKRAAGDVLACIAQAATDTLNSGQDFAIPGIGKLSTMTTKARKGRNPRNGMEVEIPAGVKVKLTVAKSLKDSVK